MSYLISVVRVSRNTSYNISNTLRWFVRHEPRTRESGFPYETIRDLIKAGHKISYGVGIYGRFQAIMKKDGVYYGASDPRKDGQAAGY